MNVRQAKRLDPIPSGFVTSRVFRLDRQQAGAAATWQLHAVDLDVPFRKDYDDGHLDDLLTLYAESSRPEELRFTAALDGSRAQGLATWRHLRWNDSIWLIDIRARPETRRRGIGSLLMECLKQTVLEGGARGIAVETQINNYPAVQFYLKHGFVVAGFNDHLYTNRDRDTQDIALFLFWPVPDAGDD